MKSGAARKTSTQNYLPLYFLMASGLCQLIGLACALGVAQLSPVVSVSLGVGALIAFGCAQLLKLSLIWRIFNLLCLPVSALAFYAEVPAPLLALLTCVGLLLYLPTFISRVPYYPSSPKAYGLVASLIKPDAQINFVDLGCGSAGMLAYLARRFPQSRFVGVELSPLAWLAAKLRILFSGLNNVEIRFANFWKLDLAKFQMVYAFLAPPPMPALWEKARNELAEDSVFITNSFPVPSVPDRELELNEFNQTKLYVHSLTPAAKI